MIVNGESLLIAAPIKDMLPIKAKAHGVSYGLSEAGYDIRIKQKIVFLPGLNEVRAYDISYHQDAVYHSNERSEIGRFIIASAIEEFDMPYNMTGIVHDKSSWARRGLSVFNTVIEPGWRGFLTLELIYHGNEPLTIPAGAGIAQVVFHQTTDHRPYSGKYMNQENKPVAAKES